jgi:L-erythro-3,5-diaminohexanoate dehydrogenase
MDIKQLSGGNRFGYHRVLEPSGVLPQPAERLDNDFSRIWNNEILVDVDTLNIDSASFTQLKEAANGDVEKIKAQIMNIVAKRGKMQNPVTGSGGMLIGTVRAVGEQLKHRDLQVGDRIATLVSLSLTPLHIDQILAIKIDVDQVSVKGQAILFESGIYAKLPDDMSDNLALAVLDVAGAAAQTAQLVSKGDTVVIIGAGGKSGILCAYQARKIAGNEGKIIGIGRGKASVERVESLAICDHVLQLSASDAIACYEAIKELTDGKMADVVINCVNIPNTEMASILMSRDGGTVYFFSMATSFTKAALGAEGVGMDVTMLIGNGYTKGHAELSLNLIRESPQLKALYEQIYA